MRSILPLFYYGLSVIVMIFDYLTQTCLKYLVECDVLKEVNISHLNKLSCSLLLSFLHNHRSRDVKALTAANIVEVFRLFHPEHPYADDDLKVCSTCTIKCVSWYFAKVRFR